MVSLSRNFGQCHDNDGSSALFQPDVRTDKVRKAMAMAMAQALLKHGAHPDARTKLGQTPRVVAKNFLIRDFLVKHGAE